MSDNNICCTILCHAVQSKSHWHFLRVINYHAMQRQVMLDHCLLLSQLEVHWSFSGHLVHLRGTVHALHAIYSGHCSYTVVRQGIVYIVTHTVATYRGLQCICFKMTKSPQCSG